MIIHASFFKESHTSLGVFYPRHYLIAVFGAVAAANAAQKNLHNSGFADSDLLVATGAEFIDFEKREAGMANILMQQISRFFKTEQSSTDSNLELAEQGTTLLFAYCPTSNSKDKAWSIIRAERPVAAHYYDRFSIDHLACDMSTD